MLKMNFNDLALLLLRVGFGGLMLTHGIPKIDRLANSAGFPDPLGIGSLPTVILAVIGEVIAPVLIIIGLKTKLAAIPSILTMAVAAFIVHASDPIGTKEKALLYLFAFIVIFLAGPGSYSIDGRKGR
ncbi:MAG: DoxX family protein [Winogradskyella sp.]|uniref:DoxX family protein n=1 Tax=Winogradskyella sp. TaxID=1883156 RepID=UPI000F3CDCDE|nr:DoxX family protein [Winogradskyella sp.]RNC87188.1 MAG: DoxX family protein [Winogradskyella sp.]